MKFTSIVKTLLTGLTFSAVLLTHASATTLSKDDLNYYKQLPPTEQVIVRAVLTVEKIYAKKPTYEGLTIPTFPEIISSNVSGQPLELSSNEISKFVAFANPPLLIRAYITYQTPSCPELIDSVKQSLYKLHIIQVIEQVKCSPAGVTVMSNIHPFL